MVVCISCPVQCAGISNRDRRLITAHPESWLQEKISSLSLPYILTGPRPQLPALEPFLPWSQPASPIKITESTFEGSKASVPKCCRTPEAWTPKPPSLRDSQLSQLLLWFPSAKITGGQDKLFPELLPVIQDVIDRKFQEHMEPLTAGPKCDIVQLRCA